ncbi:dynein light chain 1, cytoplasmic-like [Sinocyclocheilus anshuiensis]|uniref:dynein light chain 1, cytoplasmic-like n=1 Tax=Sinocyclocheilus anshuiensis TaxID=1608454 RepID=UPI0007B80CB6|nr:PREDICTED: dynein light chain 1, cytoplasmic-like [Sinocyclocheilus anshuiensis]
MAFRLQVNQANMSDAMQREALECSLLALSTNLDIATYVKQVFEERHGGYWNCIAGLSFRFHLGQVDACYVHFTLHNTSILLFKTG